MNEEEKKAIEEIGLIIESFYDFPNPISIDLKDRDVIFLETVLNLIEKQQKENELAKQVLIKNCNLADEKNQLLKENEELKQKLNEEQELNKIIKETKLNQLLKNKSY